MMAIARALVALTVALVSLVAFNSPANAWGNDGNCGKWPKGFHTNRYDAFSGHHMDVNLGICTNGTHVLWAKKPNISFPTRNPITGAGESLEVVEGPYVSDTNTYLGDVSQVTFRWSVKQCVRGTPLCQTFDFKVNVYPAGSQICFVGGACDSRKSGWN